MLMKRYLLLSLTVFTLSIPFASKAQEKSITLEQALSIVKGYYEDDITGSEEYWLLTERPEQWEIFVDERPLANWMHECSIFKFPNTGDISVDMVPEIIKPEPLCPPDEPMELLSGCAFYSNTSPGNMSSFDTSDFEKTHQITILSGGLNEKDFSFLNDCVNYQQLSQICIYDVELENNAIPDCAFVCYAVNGGFNRLQRIILPDGVETIGVMAFAHSLLKNITLPASVKTLGDGCFMGCDRIQWIHSKATVPPVWEATAEGVYPGIPNSVPVYVPAGSADAYRTAPGWSYFTTFIETDEGPFAGVEEVATPTESKAYWNNGTIVIDAQGQPTEYAVYSIGGRLVNRGVTAKNEIRIKAPKGIYIVKVGTNVFKLI